MYDSSEKALFQEAIHLGLCKKYDEEIKSVTIPIIYSQGYDKKLSKILGFNVFHEKKAEKVKKEEKKPARKYVVAAILIASIIFLVSCTVLVLQKEISYFIEEIHDTFMKIGFDEDYLQSPDYIEELYELTYIPEGYKLVVFENPANSYHRWENDAGDTIVLCQFLPEGGTPSLDTESGESMMLNLCGFDIYCRVYDDAAIYIWSDGKYGFELSVREKFDLDVVKKMIESIKIKQPKERV